MFKNLGDNLQGMAYFFLFTGIIGSVICGLALLATMPLLGIALIIGGILYSLVFSRAIYAIGKTLDEVIAVKKELAQLASRFPSVEYEHSDDPVQDATNKWKAIQERKKNQ